jgi:glycosyltransferase-like protein
MSAPPVSEAAAGSTTVRPSPVERSIGLFTYATVPRGSVVHAAALAEALVAEGWEATVYALDKDGRGFFRPLRAGVRLIPAAPAPESMADLVRQRADEIAACLASTPVQHAILHAQDCLSMSGLLAARARGALPPGTVLARTVHHVEAFADAELARCQERSIRDADLCFTVSETTRRDVAQRFAIDCGVVGNGVDLRRIDDVDPARLEQWRGRLVGTGPLLLAVGGVEPRKNSVRLLQAFALVRERHPDAQLWIAGGATVLDHGAYRAAFDEARAALEPDTRAAVVELGVLPEGDLPALFRLASVLALPSLHEGFGLVALEALAAGLPLVASACFPFVEFLDAGCAALIDPLSPADIAKGIERALRSTGARRAAGRRRAETHSWQRVAALHLEGYERRIADARDALRRPLA